jgi:hypothetical protein
MMANLLQVALLAAIGFLLVSVGIDLLRKHSYEQLSERYGLQAELENCLPEATLTKLKKNGGSRWAYRRLIREYLAN